MQTEPTEFEIDILRSLRGDKVDGLAWGAGMSAAIEWLHGRGYVRRQLVHGTLNYELTDKGREAITEVE